MKNAEVKRPVLRYHGGKWRLAKWIIEQMPPAHSVYVEAYGGGASVLFQKKKIAAEVYNDLDSSVVRVFRVLQDPLKADIVCRRLALTPFARAEFDATYEPAVDEIDAVCKTIMLSFMGHGTDSIGRSSKTGFRSKLTDERALPAASWSTWPQGVRGYVERLRGVVIECRPAVEVIRRMDTEKTLFYVDPPYVTSTRSSLAGPGAAASHGYRHEMADSDHEALAETLCGLQGMVMLSGYRSELYDRLYGDWERVEVGVLADGARPRTECLWFNAAAWNRRPQQQMFGSQMEASDRMSEKVRT